jgi:hypothetical protein
MNFALMSPEQRRELSQRGGLARAKQFTRESQQFARSHVSRAACQRNGAIGAAVTRARYGNEFMHAKWTAWKRVHPTPSARHATSSRNSWQATPMRTHHDYIQTHPE